MGKNLKSYLVTILGAEKILKVVPENTHDFEKYIQSEDLVGLVESMDGYKVKRLEGMFYNPVTQAWSFTNDSDVNYILHAKFEN